MTDLSYKYFGMILFGNGCITQELRLRVCKQNFARRINVRSCWNDPGTYFPWNLKSDLFILFVHSPTYTLCDHLKIG